MIRGRSLHVAFRVGGFGALGSVLSAVLHGRVVDRASLLVSALEVWGIVFVLWLAVEAVQTRRR